MKFPYWLPFWWIIGSRKFSTAWCWMELPVVWEWTVSSFSSDDFSLFTVIALSVVGRQQYVLYSTLMCIKSCFWELWEKIRAYAIMAEWAASRSTGTQWESLCFTHRFPKCSKKKMTVGSWKSPFQYYVGWIVQNSWK